MKFLYSIFFGGGVVAFVYTRLAKRVGYDNQQSIVITLAVIFVISTAFFYSIMALVL